jgi:hypothetical protein
MPDVGRRSCLYGVGVVAHDCARVAIARNEDHIIDASECPLQSRGILIVRNARGDSRWQARGSGSCLGSALAPVPIDRWTGGLARGRRHDRYSGRRDNARPRSRSRSAPVQPRGPRWPRHGLRSAPSLRLASPRAPLCLKQQNHGVLPPQAMVSLLRGFAENARSCALMKDHLPASIDQFPNRALIVWLSMML